MPPVCRSQIEAHEIHRGMRLEERLSLALSTIQVTVGFSSAKFPEGAINGDTTYISNSTISAWKLKGREIFSSPCARDLAHVLRVYSEGIWWHRASNPGLPFWSQML
ncbi:hypothetical protein TNCV_2831341 [Trichonephila clavipes]|nr:hypothetical protein TNCV_2831341 [Trichonephila clavipes]